VWGGALVVVFLLALASGLPSLLRTGLQDVLDLVVCFLRKLRRAMLFKHSSVLSRIDSLIVVPLVVHVSPSTRVNRSGIHSFR